MDMLEAVVLHILYSSLAASILILPVLFLRKAFGCRLGVRFQHILWVLVLIRLLIPVNLESPFSIYNLLDDRVRIFFDSQPLVFAPEVPVSINKVANEKETGSYDEDTKPQGLQPLAEGNTGTGAVSRFPVVEALSLVWLAGVLTLGLLFCIAAARLRLRERSLRQSDDPGFRLLVEQCSREFKISRHIPVYTGSGFRSPCVSGIISPRIFLPEDICARVSRQELRHILLHELAHYKRKDLLYNLFAGLAFLLHWFNPLVWLAVRRMRYDRELACDAYVMEILGEGEQELYGMTIIHLARLFIGRQGQLDPIGFYGANSQLERRINMIRGFRKGSYKITAAVIICCMVIGAATLTNAIGTGSVFKEAPSGQAADNPVAAGDGSSNDKLKDKLVIIDPGHGGEDMGAVYDYDNKEGARLKEKDLNLDISLMLCEMLKKSGVKAELTRQEDIAAELADRIEAANRLDASLFVSIHINASDNRLDNGIQTLYNPAKDYSSYGITGERAALLLQEELVKGLGITDAGLRKADSLKVLNDTKMPAVVVQLAYITNKADRQKLMDKKFREKAAQALHDGIMDELQILKK